MSLLPHRWLVDLGLGFHGFCCSGHFASGILKVGQKVGKRGLNGAELDEFLPNPAPTPIPIVFVMSVDTPRALVPIPIE